MGAAPTKPIDTSLQAYQKPLALINDAVDAYSSYNITDILRLVENSKAINMTPELKQLITQQQQFLNSNMSSRDPKNLNDMSVLDVFMQSMMKNSDLFKDMQAKRDKMLDNNVIKQLNNKGQITKVIDGLAQTYGKYKFFEFKYVQMNLFMILLSQQMSEFFTKVVLQTTASIEEVSLNLNKDFAELIKTFENLSEKPENNQKYKTLAEGTQKVLTKTHGDLAMIVEALKKNNVGLGELFTMLIKKDQEMFQAAKKSLIEAEAEMVAEQRQQQRQQQQQQPYGASQLVPQGQNQQQQGQPYGQGQNNRYPQQQQGQPYGAPQLVPQGQNNRNQGPPNLFGGPPQVGQGSQRKHRKHRARTQTKDLS